MLGNQNLRFLYQVPAVRVWLESKLLCAVQLCVKMRDYRHMISPHRAIFGIDRFQTHGVAERPTQGQNACDSAIANAGSLRFPQGSMKTSWTPLTTPQETKMETPSSWSIKKGQRLKRSKQTAKTQKPSTGLPRSLTIDNPECPPQKMKTASRKSTAKSTKRNHPGRRFASQNTEIGGTSP